MKNRGLVFLAELFLLIGGLMVVSAGCNDTDGGKYPYTAGTINYTNSTGQWVLKSDYCSGEDVYEYFCLGGDQRWLEDCGSGGCSNGACIASSAPQRIIGLSALKNAHGQIGNYTGQGIYPVSVTYRDVFGVNYTEFPGWPAYPSSGTSHNIIVKLSGPTNAHAQGNTSGAYLNTIYFGDLVCELDSSGDCNGDKKCVVTISSADNAHLALCPEAYAGGKSGIGAEAYSNKICCESALASPNAFCGNHTAKGNKTMLRTCWGNSRGINCTWTPLINDTTKLLTTSTVDGGHCCGPGTATLKPGVWNKDELECDYGTINDAFCTTLWITDRNAGSDLTSTPKRYCSQLFSGVDKGLWKPVETY